MNQELLSVDELLYLLSSGQLTPEQLAELPDVDDHMLSEMAEVIMWYTAVAHKNPASVIWEASDEVH